MSRWLFFIVIGLIPVSVFAQAPPPQTVAEKSQYQQTSRHADVLAFGEQLAKLSPKITVSTYGKSGEGRPLPLWILSDPPVKSIEEALQSERPLLFAFANIHAGEVDGKEALQAMARDLLLKNSSQLKEAIFLLAPNINPDGNEAFSNQNRRTQNGPPSVGIRENAAGYDLNRDFIKLETPEIRALVRLVNLANPLVVIDCHTTNGSRHRYTLTYDGPGYPAADPQLIEYARNTLFPDITRSLKKATGYDSFFYGNFSRDRSSWETYPATPRFSTPYLALRNRLGLLSESYSYSSFQDRIQASYHFVKAAFDHVLAHRKTVEKLLVDAEKPKKRVVLRTRPTAFDKDVTILGYDEKERDKPKDLTLKFVGKMQPTLEVDLPNAYVIAPNFPKVIENLQRHGIVLQELREDRQLEVESYTVKEIQRSETPFQRHRLISLEVEKKKQSQKILAGSVIVPTSQKLGTLAAYLLEPQSEDGLAAWNYFDESLQPKGEFPVTRLLTPQVLHTGSPRPLAEDRVMNKPITIDFLLQQPPGPSRRAPGDSPQTWLPDGEHYTQMRAGKRWKINARTGVMEPLSDKFADSMKSLPAEATRPMGAGRGRAGGGGGARAAGLTDSRQSMQLIDTAEGTYVVYADGKPAQKLKLKPGPREYTSFAPNSEHIVFVRQGNLIAVDLKTLEEKPLTTDGGGDILNGRADWVYEEEIFNRNGQSYWWSPDGQAIAFLRYDDKPVKRFTIADPFPAQGRGEVYAYPKPGDPNPLVKLCVVTVADGKITELDLKGYYIQSTLLARVGWIPGKKAVYAYVQNRVQTWLDFVTWDLETGARTKLFRDQTRAWIEDPGEPEFLPDGSFLFLSERSGWKHLYHYSKSGELIRPVTLGDWEISRVHRVDPDKVYFSATKDSSNGSNFYRIDLDGKNLTRLTPEDGSHQVTLAPKGDLFLDRHTDNATPARTLLRGNKGEVIRMLDTNPTYEREEYRFGKYERVQIPMKDGFILEGAIVYPPDFDPKKPYPIWISTYAGPHAPTVREGWSYRGFEQVLASMGIISFRVDPRSASGKGAISAWSCYKKMGVQELKDLEEAVDWIGKNNWADLKRVGISGHSYGGFMTAFALTHSTKFAAGIAGAPPTDWRLYDTIYTERYMGLPEENKSGYDETSCLTAANKLHGKLLIAHGAMDDNVHMQNTLQFIDALQKAGKPFEMMVYPRSRHGIVGAHYTRLQFDFIQRALKP